MGYYVGVEMSDHQSAMNSGKKTPKTGTYKKKKRARKRAESSRRRNR